MRFFFQPFVMKLFPPLPFFFPAFQTLRKLCAIADPWWSKVDARPNACASLHGTISLSLSVKAMEIRIAAFPGRSF